MICEVAGGFAEALLEDANLSSAGRFLPFAFTFASAALALARCIAVDELTSLFLEYGLTPWIPVPFRRRGEGPIPAIRGLPSMCKEESAGMGKWRWYDR